MTAKGIQVSLVQRFQVLIGYIWVSNKAEKDDSPGFLALPDIYHTSQLDSP